MKKDHGGSRVGNLGVGRILATSVVLMLFCAHGMATSLSEYHVGLSDGALDIQLPEHRSRDFFESTAITGVQVEDERNYNSSSREVLLLRRAVDYKTGFLFKRSSGVMIITISVLKVAHVVVEGDISRIDNFASQFGVYGRLTEQPRRIRRHEDDWYVFSILSPIETEQRLFVARLGDDKYLLIQFEFVDKTHGDPRGWKHSAHEDMHRIFSSAKLRTPRAIENDGGSK